MITSHDVPLQASTATPSYITQVQSHSVANVIMRTGTMQRNTLYLLVAFTILVFFLTLNSANQVSLENSRTYEQSNTITRVKRQLEDLENDDYPTPSTQESQEETGFWDRVVKVALKLFSRFIEWLNSS